MGTVPRGVLGSLLGCDCACLSSRCPEGASCLSEFQAVLVLGDFEFLSSFILLKLLDP